MTRERIEKLLSQTIGQYIRKYISLINHDVFVSISKLSITRDLDIVRVHLALVAPYAIDASIFLSEMMSVHHWPIRKYVATKLRHVLRRIPAEIRFYID